MRSPTEKLVDALGFGELRPPNSCFVRVDGSTVSSLLFIASKVSKAFQLGVSGLCKAQETSFFPGGDLCKVPQYRTAARSPIVACDMRFEYSLCDLGVDGPTLPAGLLEELRISQEDVIMLVQVQDSAGLGNLISFTVGFWFNQECHFEDQYVRAGFVPLDSSCVSEAVVMSVVMSTPMQCLLAEIS
jgi:hypothetical protein